jgi:hypothetical protein
LCRPRHAYNIMTFIIINDLRCRILFYFIVYLIGFSLSLTHSLEEGNTMRDYDLTKVPMLVYFLPTGNND